MAWLVRSYQQRQNLLIADIGGSMQLAITAV
jgi:hypothetical protein